MWGGRSQARIVENIIIEKHHDTTEASVIFDAQLDELAFSTKTQFINKVDHLKELIGSLSHFVVCIGGEHGRARCETAETLMKLGLEPFSAIDYNTHLDVTCEIGRGSQIMPGVTVYKFTKIGDYCIINTNASVDHECVVGDGVHIMGSAAVAGRVCIGKFATIGTNATVLPDISLGEGCFVGAGTVVTRDVKPYEVVTGIPARKLRDIAPKVNYGLLRDLLE